MGVAAKRGWSWANTSASPGALARASGAVAACCSDVSIWQPPRLEKMHELRRADGAPTDVRLRVGEAPLQGRPG